jgi:protein-S-isoprenylcysteine O-methyltransferase Ste14
VELTIDMCADGLAASVHYPPPEWEYLGSDGLCFGTPSDTVIATARQRGAEIVAYDGDGMWNFYRCAPGASSERSDGGSEGSQSRLQLADLALIGAYAWFVFINLGAAGRGDLSVLLLILQECCVIGLALVRRRASVSAQWESSEALLGYLGTLTPALVRPAELAPLPWLTIGVGVQAVGNILALIGILQLGGSFGIVAANRGVETGGLYQVIRHPIYAAYLLAFGGFVLAHPSLYNSVVLLVWASIQVARIGAEERLLGKDQAYCAYRRIVRYRLIPGLW